MILINRFGSTATKKEKFGALMSLLGRKSSQNYATSPPQMNWLQL